MDEKSVTSQILPRAGKSAKLVVVKHLMMVILGRDNYFAWAICVQPAQLIVILRGTIFDLWEILQMEFASSSRSTVLS